MSAAKMTSGPAGESMVYDGAAILAAEAARTLVADADIRGVVAFLLDVDADGAWSPRDASQALRERASDLAAQGVVDGIVDLETVRALLAVVL